jgi:hypothetical protein
MFKKVFDRLLGSSTGRDQIARQQKCAISARRFALLNMPFSCKFNFISHRKILSIVYEFFLLVFLFCFLFFQTYSKRFWKLLKNSNSRDSRLYVKCCICCCCCCIQLLLHNSSFHYADLCGYCFTKNKKERLDKSIKCVQLQNRFNQQRVKCVFHVQHTPPFERFTKRLTMFRRLPQ